MPLSFPYFRNVFQNYIHFFGIESENIVFLQAKLWDMIKRILEKKIQDNIHQGKAIVLMGARQTGKTTLLNELFSEDENVFWLNGDEIDVCHIFENISATRLRNIIGEHKIVIIDEAQRINDVGLRLKLITDQMKDIQLIATGSSSFDLSNKINEPLTGRKWEYQVFPLSFAEMVAHHGLLTEQRLLPERLIYGSYPEVVSSPGKERKILNELVNSCLYKDILTFDQVKKTDSLIRLLQALAFQVGSQVSYYELAQTCGMDSKTVEKYIILLEQSYIVFRLGCFSRNLRSELKKSRKIYFYDNGIRNTLISNLLPIESRTDTGALWENYMISERHKYLSYNEIYSNGYFWRTVEQQEIDYLEDYDGCLAAFEFKWNENKRSKLPVTFAKAYPQASFQCITRENYEQFISRCDL